MNRFFLLFVALLSSCSTTKTCRQVIDYDDALNKVRLTTTTQGIPRQKIFYHFRLYGVPSARLIGGVRGGFSTCSEHWDLPDGSKLSAYKHTKVAKIVFRDIKAGQDGKLPFPAVGEKYYHEPCLESFFDSLYLTSAGGRLAGKIELPLHN